jgi:mannitol/fructose-specific phosphotransferase system IIA component (Ntr-type)
MRVSDVLCAGGIVLRPPWHTFEEAASGLVDQLVRNGQLPPALAPSAVRAVCEREREASTAIVEIGVSIPHARIDGVQQLVAAVAGAPSAVYYHMTRVPITVMALVLSPPDQAAEHLNFLSALSMLLQSEALRRRLVNAADADAALTLLRGPAGR